LFWDTILQDIDAENHAGFIVERVVERGDMADWQTLLKLYGEKRILSEAVALRSLDSKTVNFLSVYFRVSKKEFRCCT
jgi:hypothetical protein